MKLKRWAGNVFCAALLTGFTLLLAGCAMGRAPVSGVVVDSKTGEPIKGAELFVEASYYCILPPSEVEQGGADGEGVSDEKGVFHISAALLHPGFINSIFPRKVDGIDMCVYARDYVTILTKIPVHLRGKKWSKNGVTVDKKITGYVVTVKMEKATTQKAWQRKCDTTVWAKGSGFAKDEWVFNDLTRYLERWPDGEKARRYYVDLWSTAMLDPCDYMREEWANGKLSMEHLKVLCGRAEKIITLAEQFNKPPEGMTKDSFQRGLEEHKQDLSCARKLLQESKSSVKGGKP